MTFPPNSFPLAEDAFESWLEVLLEAGVESIDSQSEAYIRHTLAGLPELCHRYVLATKFLIVLGRERQVLPDLRRILCTDLNRPQAWLLLGLALESYDPESAVGCFAFAYQLGDDHVREESGLLLQRCVEKAFPTVDPFDRSESYLVQATELFDLDIIFEVPRVKPGRID